jgi:hypothetical protein
VNEMKRYDRVFNKEPFITYDWWGRRKVEGIFDDALRNGRTHNIFYLLALQKNIMFEQKDIEEYGEEILDALYLGGYLK